MSESDPQWGRPARRMQREHARELAKEIFKSYRQGAHRYRTDLWWTVVLTVVSLGWDFLKETIMKNHPVWRVVIGCFLFACAYAALARLFVRWSSDKKWNGPLRYVLVVAVSIGVLYWGYSTIAEAAAPTYVLVEPGLVLQDGVSRVYYYAAKHDAMHNLKIIVWDDSDAANMMSFHLPELNVRTGGFAETFVFKPKNLGHERLSILVQSRDGDTDEKLSVETRGAAKFPAYQAVVRDSRAGTVVFQCESSDFPQRNTLQPCANDVLTPP